MNAVNDKRRSLGRGLSALLPVAKPVTTAAPSDVSTSNSENGDAPPSLQQIPVVNIIPYPGQPRHIFDETRLDELASSIKVHGVLQPLLVRKKDDKYELIAGERRWRAAQRAGLSTLPCILSEVAPEDVFTLALVENLQRADLNPIEEAQAYLRLQELGHSQSDIAQAVGKDRTTISNSLRLLKLPQDVQRMVVEGQLTMGHARALLSLEETESIMQMAQRVVDEGWSVRQTERAVADTKRPPEEPAPAEAAPEAAPEPAPAENPALREVRSRLQTAFGTKVDVKHKNGRGTVVVHFNNFEELDALMQRVQA